MIYTHRLWLIAYESYKDSSEIPNLILILIFTKLSTSNMVATCYWITRPDCFLNPFFWNQIHGKIPVILFYFQWSFIAFMPCWWPARDLRTLETLSWPWLVNNKFEISIRFGTLVDDIAHFKIKSLIPIHLNETREFLKKFFLLWITGFQTTSGATEFLTPYNLSFLLILDENPFLEYFLEKDILAT